MGKLKEFWKDNIRPFAYAGILFIGMYPLMQSNIGFFKETLIWITLVGTGFAIGRKMA